MKNILRYVLTVIVVIAAGSCSVKETSTIDTLSPKGEELVFTAESGEIGTKTALQADETTIWWSPKDEICVYYGASEGDKFTAANEVEVAKAEFRGTLSAFTGVTETGDFNYFWAVYPYSSAVGCDGTGVTAMLPTIQEAKAGSFAPNTNITIAKSAGLALSFYNACSWFRFSVTKEGIKTVSFKGNNNEDIAGQFSVSIGSEGKPTAPQVIDGRNEIVLSMPDGGTFEVGEMYYITLLPQVLEKGFTVTFRTANEIGSRSINSKATFLRSKYNTGKSFDKDVEYTEKEVVPTTGIIQFADEKVKEKLVAAFDTDEDGELSYGEAAAVTSADDFKAAFGSIKTYKTFDEFQYFTGLTQIPESMFKDWRLTSIVLPANITSIGYYAFQNCSSLASVIIPEGVTFIGIHAFSDCNSLTSITIPEGVKAIYAGVFSDCTSLSSIAIPDSVVLIAASAFQNCSSLVSITIPTGVKAIFSAAFSGCSSLTSITIPEGVKSIEESVFKDCCSLAFINIPEKVTSIGEYAFSGCSSLSSITIPDGVTSIGKYAFYNCSSLSSSIIIPDGVTSIGQGTFSGCSSLISITIPESVTSIGGGAFISCKSLSSITIPESVTFIGGSAFSSCSSLSSIIIPDGVTSIGQYAFSWCSSLSSITIPEKVTSIGDNAFRSCSSLSTIIIPEGVTAIADYTFFGCSSLNSITIPERVTSIGDHAFDSCSSLSTITISKNVTYIGDFAFQNCSSLASITIPEGVTSIRSCTFSGCSRLSSITIPENVDYIGDFAFKNCYSLSFVTILATTVPSCAYGVLSGASSCPIYVPAESVSAYKSASGWSSYASRIQAIPVG